MNQVIVVGGGAAGMIAALSAAESGAAVRLYEKNEKLGKKLFITGKGRCNVTNDADAEEFFSNVITNRKFFYSPYYSFSNQEMMTLLEQLGVPLKTERGGRVFPASDKSSDVIRGLENGLIKAGVQVFLNSGVKELLLEKGRCCGIMLEDGRKERGNAVILAAGGCSYPSTGSTGDGYRMAESAGHAVTSLRPALAPLLVEEEFCKELQGLSLRNISLRLLEGKKELYSGFGEMLFTHFGISGPLVLSASSRVVKRLEKGPLKAELDLKPALSQQALDSRILRDFEEARNKCFKNSLGKLYPVRLAEVMVRLSGIDPEKQVNAVTAAERRRLLELTKHFPMTVTGVRGFSEAIITQGGVEVKGVNPSTMESKLAPGLYFAGELLDLDALTGGFNLQIAWSTGWAAGEAAGRNGGAYGI